MGLGVFLVEKKIYEFLRLDLLIAIQHLTCFLKCDLSCL